MMKIGNHTFDVEHDCSIMGILNVTPTPSPTAAAGMISEAARCSTPPT